MFDTHHHIHHHYASDNTKVLEQLQSILSQLNNIKMTQQEALDKVTALTAQVDKVKTEITDVKNALEAALANSQNVPDSLADAIRNLGSSIQAADDLNADKGTDGGETTTS